MPEIEKPKRRQDGTDKMVWTGMALFIYLVCSQVPLVGIKPTNQGDALYWMRVILASNKGTLMELGISPIVTASMGLQFFKGSGLMSAGDTARDRKLVQGFEKVIAVAVAVASSVGYASTGAYGAISTTSFVLIVAQLTFASMICIMLDELLQKGYGFGSAISLFVATNVCEQVIWTAFCPLTVNAGRGEEIQGAVIAFFQQLAHDPTNFQALKETFYRTHLPNMNSLVATAVLFCIVNYVQGFSVNVPLIHPNSRQTYPQKIALFYTSSMPIVLMSAFVSNVVVMSQVLSQKFGSSTLANLFGEWKTSRTRGSVPVGGFAYYVTPPEAWENVVEDPAKGVFYVLFVIGVCSIFGTLWIGISGQSPREVASQWRQAGLTAKGGVSLESIAERHIPVAASLGGACVGALTIVGDAMGAAGSGTGILLAVGFLHSYVFCLFCSEALGENSITGVRSPIFRCGGVVQSMKQLYPIDPMI